MAVMFTIFIIYKRYITKKMLNEAYFYLMDELRSDSV